MNNIVGAIDKQIKLQVYIDKNAGMAEQNYVGPERTEIFKINVNKEFNVL